MMELYQAEWCPSCKRVRMRLTELGIDFIARQVEADPEHRMTQQGRFSTRSIPLLVLSDGETIAGADAILSRLERLDDPPSAARHRERAATAEARQRQHALDDQGATE